MFDYISSMRRSLGAMRRRKGITEVPSGDPFKPEPPTDMMLDAPLSGDIQKWIEQKRRRDAMLAARDSRDFGNPGDWMHTPRGQRGSFADHASPRGGLRGRRD